MQTFEMQPKLASLMLVLQSLGLEPDISSTAGRKLIQKAVYFAQRGGVNLGYRFGWYKMGPYSRSLADDYYALARALAAGDQLRGQSLRDAEARKLAALSQFFSLAEGTRLSKEDWLELLASVDYLQKVLRYPVAQATDTIRGTKGHLAGHLNSARQRLKEMPLQG
jgi:uncharacterized protein YwgA